MEESERDRGPRYEISPAPQEFKQASRQADREIDRQSGERGQ